MRETRSGRVVRVVLGFIGLLPSAARCQTPPLPAGAVSNGSTATTTGQGAVPAPQPAPSGFLEQEELTGGPASNMLDVYRRANRESASPK
jgi:hypothetical protein